MADYCTTSDVIAIMPDSGLAQTTDTNYTTALGVLITAASRLIDKEVGRWDNYFYPSTDTETRYFDGSGLETQDVDEMVSLTSVAVAETGGTAAADYTTWTENTDFYTWPYNRSGNTRPIRQFITDYNGDKYDWPAFRKAVKVVGVFGYAATPPADIAHACSIQTMRWYMRAQNAQQDAGANPALGTMTYVRELDPDVKVLLYHYQLENIT